MALLESSDMSPGTAAPAFTLPDTRNGKSVSLGDYAGMPLVVVFMCNHCPYVVHLVDELVQAALEFANQGVATVAISANDVTAYPADHPDKMAALAHDKGFDFPYLYDETQRVALAYDAVCTPDIFLFDADHKLFYHGQFDDTRPGRGEDSTGADLRQAVDELLAGNAGPSRVKPSVGCSIKWRAA